MFNSVQEHQIRLGKSQFSLYITPEILADLEQVFKVESFEECFSALSKTQEQKNHLILQPCVRNLIKFWSVILVHHGYDNTFLEKDASINPHYLLSEALRLIQIVHEQWFNPSEAPPEEDFLNKRDKRQAVMAQAKL